MKRSLHDSSDDVAVEDPLYYFYFNKCDAAPAAAPEDAAAHEPLYYFYFDRRDAAANIAHIDFETREPHGKHEDTN